MQSNRSVAQPFVARPDPPTRAAGFAAPVELQDALEGTARTALELAGIGVAVLRSDASAVTMNPVCRRLLASAKRGLLWSGEVLHARRRTTTLALRRALAGAALGRTRAIRVEDMAGPGVIELLASGTTPSPRRGPRITVIMRAPVDAAPDEALLAQLYGLTPAEAGLAGALVSGIGLPRACAARGIRLNTGKGYLKRIFEKTGTRRQSELVAVVMRGVASLSRS